MDEDDGSGNDGGVAVNVAGTRAIVDWSNEREALEVCRGLIEHEAVLLEEQRWDEWLDLFRPDCTYWVPAWRRDGILASNPQRELSLIYYSNRGGLEDRIVRIRSSNSPAGRLMARTTHLIGNVRLQESEGDAGSIAIGSKASWATYVFSPRSSTTDIFFGQVEHRLVFDGERWRIAYKKIILQNDYLPTSVDIYCL
jgi:3-phenylpropionate/cinnamic acid dioxygenase small subunit